MLHRKRLNLIVTTVVSVGLLAGCAGGNQPAKQEGGAAGPLSMQFLVPSYADSPNMNDEYWSEWQKRTNSKLDVEWVPSGDYDTKFDLVLASGNLPEIIVSTNITRSTLLSAIKQGAFWDLTP